MNLKYVSSTKQRFLTALILVLVLGATQLCAAATNSTNAQSWENTTKKYEFAMEQAATDLATNAEGWVDLQQEVDGATGFGWKKWLSIKLISQPIAVLSIMKRTQLPPEEVCYPPFMEGAAYYEVNNWLMQTQQTLQAFTMVDPIQEHMRQQCLDIVNKTPQLKPGE